MKESNDEKLSRLDYTVSISSGLLTALMDILFISDISLENALDWGTKRVEEFVIQTAKKKKYQGESLAGAIKYLEDSCPFSSDKATNEFGGGLQHHLRDFTHHCSPLGLFFSIISQFTGYIYGTDTSGKLIRIAIPDWQKTNPRYAIYMGTVGWLLHMISDMAGSSGSALRATKGTGIPGPILSFLKATASLPGIRNTAGKDKNGNYNFSKSCSKLFNGTMLGEHDENGKIISQGIQFDFRTELGIRHEAITNKQYIPVILNDLIVCAFYSVSRLCQAIDRQATTDISRIDAKIYLPFNNPKLRHMRMIASVTFTSVDLIDAGIESYIKNKNDRSGFAKDFLSKINYFSLGHLTLSASNELIWSIKKLYDTFEKSLDDKSRFYLETGKKLILISKLTSITSWIMACKYVYTQISSAVSEYNIAIEERKQIENNCANFISVLEEYHQEIESATNQYMQENISVFDFGTEKMDQAITNQNTDLFISGSNIVQEQLGKENQFSSKDNFDEFMSSDKIFKF